MRVVATIADLPKETQDRLAAEAVKQTEREKDPTKLTVIQRLERLEKILGLDQPMKGGGRSHGL
jgi:hypothetical protein